MPSIPRSVLITAASRLAPRYDTPGDNQNKGPFGNGNPFQNNNPNNDNDDDDDDDDDDEGIDIPPGAIVGIVVAIVVFFLITTGYCVYKDRQRRRKAREKQVEIALKQSPSQPIAPQVASEEGVSQSHHDAPPPPYEAAHIATRHPGVVHQWDPRDEDITGANSTVTDGIPPEGGGKGGGLRIGA